MWYVDGKVTLFSLKTLSVYILYTIINIVTYILFIFTFSKSFLFPSPKNWRRNKAFPYHLCDWMRAGTITVSATINHTPESLCSLSFHHRCQHSPYYLSWSRIRFTETGHFMPFTICESLLLLTGQEQGSGLELLKLILRG